MGPFLHDSHGQEGPPHPDAILADLADRQHGLVSKADIAAVLSRGGFEHRVRRGRLHRVHDGVYAVGRRRLTREGIWLAAVIACGPGAALSHRDGGALWEIRRSARRAIDVTTPRRGRRGREGIDLHRVRRLDPDDVTVRNGIP